MKRKIKAINPARDRLVFDVLHELSGLRAVDIARAAQSEAETDKSRASVSPATIRKWRLRLADGGTRYPQSIKLDAALAIVGKRLGVVPSGLRARKK